MYIIIKTKTEEKRISIENISKEDLMYSIECINNGNHTLRDYELNNLNKIISNADIKDGMVISRYKTKELDKQLELFISMLISNSDNMWDMSIGESRNQKIVIMYISPLLKIMCSGKITRSMVSPNQIERASAEDREWTKLIKNKFNNTCVCCQSKIQRGMSAHHIMNWSSNPDLRFEITNGICLCKKCHDMYEEGSFHQIYGTYNNTKDQLQEYVDNKRKELGLSKIRIDDAIR